MALERVSSLDLTGFRQIEALLCAAVGLQFRHSRFSFLLLRGNKRIQILFTGLGSQENGHVAVYGASGSGKTWISNAFGVNACMERYRVQYTRLPDLFQEIEEAKIQGHYKKYMKKLSKVDLLILDEFLLTTISECERNDLFEVIQSRTDKKSTIYCSQWAPEGWLGKLGDGPLADAILDRIRNSSYTILLKGRSLREDYSKIK